jgi:cyclopropane-fatty-acyl-phospholipid synthase
MRIGWLQMGLPDGSVRHFGDPQANGSLRADIQLQNWEVFSAAMKSGDIGFAETYVSGAWNSSNLSALLRVLTANRQVLELALYGTWLGRLGHRLRHLFNRNTRAGSKRNIHAHYDLGNGFYSTWLDTSMTYSSALFDGNFSLTTLEAQHLKIRRALQQSQVQPGERLLEIGCGWGSLAELAIEEFGARVTGVTLSHEQLAYAKSRLACARDRADLRLQDYRDIQDSPFDAICSIEMVEAVGHAYWPQYFQTVARLLKPGGRACIQAITIDDGLFERYIRSTDFIQQYIFPGGCLPSPSEFRKAAGRYGLQVVEEHDFGLDYAETCRRWRHDFLAHRATILGMGFDERFMRIWEFYLCYCEAAFEERNTSVMQFTLVKA